jgi:hypothetical protein
MVGTHHKKEWTGKVGTVDQIFDGKPDWGSISERQWAVGTCDPEGPKWEMQNP